MQLEVRINGVPTGLIGEFTERDGALLARGSELRAIGIEAEPGPELVPLATLRGIEAKLNALTQVLEITAEAAALRRTQLSGKDVRSLPELTPANWSLVVNYDALGTFSGANNAGALQNEVRLLGPYGTVATNTLSRLGTLSPGQDFVRLESNWTYSEPEHLRGWRLGDLVTGGVGWSRAIRLGGGQVASDFNMRPDLVRYGTPSFTGLAATPSTVDVLVNGVRQFSSSVPVGPFELRSLPVLASGGSEVVIAVRDAVGRQTLTTLPFYSSTLMLAEGLTSYSAEAGQVRLGYGLRNTDYVSWMASGSVRHGYKTWLTLEGHAEATDGLNQAGAGGALRLGDFGVISMALAGSAGRGATLPPDITARYGVLGKALTGPGQGGQVALGLQHGTAAYSLNLTTSVASAGYRDTATLFGTATVRSSMRAALSVPLRSYGSLTLAWIAQRGGNSLGTQVSGVPLSTPPSSSLLNIGYTVALRNDMFFYVSGFYDLRGGVGSGLFAGLIFSFGAHDSASLSYNRQDRSSTYSAQVLRPAVQPGDLGWQLLEQEGDVSRRLGELQYLSPWGRATLGVDQGNREVSGRAGFGGAVVVGGGSAFLSDRIYDSFAVVRTGSEPGVPVQFENRPIGRTRWDGRLLVPHLRSFDANQLAIDPLVLPADIEADRTRLQVRPGDRSGVVVDFGVRRNRGALIRFQSAAGEPVPRGSVVRREGHASVTVGRDGRAYLTGLAAANEVAIDVAGGGSCRAAFAYTPTDGDIPRIGPVPCR